jgi:hypothetical protein
MDPKIFAIQKCITGEAYSSVALPLIDLVIASCKEEVAKAVEADPCQVAVGEPMVTIIVRVEQRTT